MEKNHRRNREITGDKILLVGVSEKPLEMSLREAQSRADDEGLDLVEIAVNDKGQPVCKVMDYGAFLYHEAKRMHENQKKNRDHEIKEMRFRPVTDEGDFNTKVKQMVGFLEKGHKVKVAIRFKGREITFAQAGFEMMGKISAALESIAKSEIQQKVEGRQLTGMFSPLANRPKAKT